MTTYVVTVHQTSPPIEGAESAEEARQIAFANEEWESVETTVEEVQGGR